MPPALDERSRLVPPPAPSTAAAPSALPALATRPLLLIAAAVTGVLLLTSGRYGIYADELYFLAAGHHLDWGYVDQPPLVPLIALLADTAFPGSLLALRLLPALAAGAGVVLTALLARELGGDRRAQLLAGGAWAVAGQTLGGGHMLATVSFDPVLWTAVLWPLVRWVRLREQGVRQDRLLLAACACTALAMQVKLLIPVLWLVLGLVLLCTGPRSLLRRPLLWAGAAGALLTAAPTLWWQATHGWPQLSMGEAVAAESSFGVLLLPAVVLCAGIPGGVLVCFGCWRLLRAPELRPYRFLGWTVLGVAVLVALTESRPYYLAGAYGLLFAVGAVQLRARWFSARLYAVSALVAVVATLPVLPVGLIPRFDLVGTGSVGWPELTAIVERNAREHAAPVIAEDYWVASAVHHYGRTEVHSASRGYWAFGRPAEHVRSAIYVGGRRDFLLRHFGSVRRVDTVRTGLPSLYEGTPVWVVSEPRRPWELLWRDLWHIGLRHDGTPSGAPPAVAADG
ncbi:glycosyltransferase family 39 protein [Saccharopolyspora gregorii]|uniref:Glycosyltransferase family 39 protein n=1 Tax=Saccharopolyspora gregorii TaxID=33914 RepID=A0ABP6S042_9PSEU